MIYIKLNVDLEMSYSFDAEKAPALYTKYAGMDGKEIINNIVRGKVKVFVNEITSKYTVIEAHMEKKQEVNAEITKHLKEKLAEFGVVVESANLSRTSVNAEVQAAITKRSQASQELEAEKQKKLKAEVEAERLLIEAKAKADAEVLAAEGKAKANEKINSSLTENLIESEAIKKWDGKLPQVSGGTGVVDFRGK